MVHIALGLKSGGITDQQGEKEGISVRSLYGVYLVKKVQFYKAKQAHGTAPPQAAPHCDCMFPKVFTRMFYHREQVITVVSVDLSVP